MDVDLVKIYGEKMAEQLSLALGDKAIETITRCEIERLLQVPGLGRKKALAIIRKAYEYTHGEAFDNILTGNAEATYDKLITLLQSYLVTEGAKNKLHVYFPVKDKNIITTRQDYFENAACMYKKIESSYQELKIILKRISRIKNVNVKKYHDYVVLTDSEEAMPQLKNPYCDVLFMSSPDEAKYAHNSYPFVIYVMGPDSNLAEYGDQYADRIMDVEEFDPSNIVPDAAVNKFLQNEGTLKAIERFLWIIGKEESFLKEILGLIDKYKNKDAIKDKKITPDKFIELLKTKEKELNKKLSGTIQERGIGIKANDLLQLVSSLGASEDPVEALKRSLPEEFGNVYQSLVKKITDEVYGLSGIDISSLFPQDFTYPVVFDSEKIYDMRSELEASDFKSQYKLKKEIASYSKKWGDIDRLLFDVIEYDFMLGIGRFINENCCTRPSFANNGISFIDGSNPFLKKPIPISYKLGVTTHNIATEDRITLLTGANSGGKTTLLETVLVCQILTQMGLFVPAELMQTTIYEKIRYLAKAKSQNAGAFEGTISSLVPIAIEKGKRLILIDELESITEPGSAACIIATLINILQENEDAFAIIVTHLGDEIDKLCNVRVDGIGANGLDDDLNLIVDRQPAFGTIGKSTPELIVEKLYRKSEGETKRVYGEMLKKLKETQQG